jgi:ATP-dependent Clp protease ATP-binding subunit ClpA
MFHIAVYEFMEENTISQLIGAPSEMFIKQKAGT